MKTRVWTAIAVAAATVAALTGCGVFAGAPTTQERQIEAAGVVQLKTGGDLVITIGEPSLTISAGSNVIDRLTSDVHGDTLVLDAPGPNIGGLGEIRYALTLPAVSEVRVEGSGDVEVDFAGADEVRVTISGSGDVDARNLDAGSVTTEIRGSGEIDLAGEAGDLEVLIDGSGEVNAYELEARTASVTIRGSGEVDVFVLDELDVDISGSGTVRHKGGATVNSNISGSGDVIAQ